MSRRQCWRTCRTGSPKPSLEEDPEEEEAEERREELGREHRQGGWGGRREQAALDLSDPGGGPALKAESPGVAPEAVVAAR